MNKMVIAPLYAATQSVALMQCSDHMQFLVKLLPFLHSDYQDEKFGLHADCT